MLVEILSPSDIHQNTVALAAHLGVKSSVSGEQGGGGPDSSGRVLLIEDDTHIAEMYRYQLASDGYVVSVAHSGNRGLDLIRDTRPDLVLLDLRLPEMDGFEVLEALRSDASLISTPVVVLSNFGDPDMIRRARSLGARDYLVKSRITPDEVSSRIRVWIADETLH